MDFKSLLREILIIPIMKNLLPFLFVIFWLMAGTCYGQENM